MKGSFGDSHEDRQVAMRRWGQRWGWCCYEPRNTTRGRGLGGVHATGCQSPRKERPCQHLDLTSSLQHWESRHFCSASQCYSPAKGYKAQSVGLERVSCSVPWSPLPEIRTIGFCVLGCCGLAGSKCKDLARCLSVCHKLKLCRQNQTDDGCFLFKNVREAVPKKSAVQQDVFRAKIDEYEC